MNPMDPRPEDFDRSLKDRQAEMRRARDLGRFAHSRTGLLVRHLGRLVDRLDPTGRQRRQVQ